MLQRKKMYSEAESSSDFYSRVIRKIFPSFSIAHKSRFVESFQDLEYLQKQKKRSAQIQKEQIIAGRDKRTTIMIKNIPLDLPYDGVLEKFNFDEYLNYFYVPTNEKSGKILGFAFANVKSYLHIINIFESVVNFNKNLSKDEKKCEICYANVQGIRALINTFGKKYLKKK